MLRPITNNFQLLGNYLLEQGHWLNSSDEARAYVNEHSQIFNNSFAISQEHSRYVLENFCTRLFSIDDMSHVLDMEIDFNLERFPVGIIIRVESDAEEETCLFKRVHPDWFMKIDGDVQITQGS
ncbi:hypothetical protein AB4259_02750 [Vibrio amylolyticus]|uniref:hypothetical protein n=1 Tax=Vibrio amylolyticus TaxID=2847292 RepID=UPI00354F8B9F